MSHSATNGIRMKLNLLSALVACCLIVALPGCAIKHWLVPKPQPVPPALAANATLDEITDHLNKDRSQLMRWRSSQVTVTASGEGILSPRLSANICVESPRNLRLMASAIGPEVDFGSNDERFWFWMKRQEPKVLLTGSHEGLGRQQVLPIPFPPDWLMQALGVVPIDTSTSLLERDGSSSGRVRIVSQSSETGRQVKRVMVVDLHQGQIVEHILFDARNQMLASAKLSEFKQEPNGGVTLAHKIELIWPEMKSVLTLDIGRIEVNQDIPATTWQMKNYPNYEIVDLDDENAGRL